MSQSAATTRSVKVGTSPTQYGFLVMPNFSMIAFAAAIDTLRLANRISGEELYSWETLTTDGKPVLASNGLEVSDTGDAVDEPMLRRERVAMVRAALRTLSDDHRSILVLREMQDYSYEDIAEILEISIGTVRSRLSRARQQLKLALEAMQRAEESKG